MTKLHSEEMTVDKEKTITHVAGSAHPVTLPSPLPRSALNADRLPSRPNQSPPGSWTALHAIVSTIEAFFVVSRGWNGD